MRLIEPVNTIFIDCGFRIFKPLTENDNDYSVNNFIEMVRNAEGISTAMGIKARDFIAKSLAECTIVLVKSY